MSEIKDKPGLLSTIHPSDDEFQLLLEYLEKTRGNNFFDILYNLFDQDDFLKFCDMFSGATLRMPKREEVYKITNYIKIFYYVRCRGFNELTIAQASKEFDRKPASIIRIYKKVDEMLTSDLKDIRLSRRND